MPTWSTRVPPELSSAISRLEKRPDGCRIVADRWSCPCPVIDSARPTGALRCHPTFHAPVRGWFWPFWFWRKRRQLERLWAAIRAARVASGATFCCASSRPAGASGARWPFSCSQLRRWTWGCSFRIARVTALCRRGDCATLPCASDRAGGSSGSPLNWWQCRRACKRASSRSWRGVGRRRRPKRSAGWTIPRLSVGSVPWRPRGAVPTPPAFSAVAAVGPWATLDGPPTRSRKQTMWN